MTPAPQHDRRQGLVPILSGILIGTSYIPFSSWASLFCFMPVWVFWLRQSTLRHVVIGGFVTAFVFLLIGFNWGHLPAAGACWHELATRRRRHGRFRRRRAPVRSDRGGSLVRRTTPLSLARHNLRGSDGAHQDLGRGLLTDSVRLELRLRVARVAPAAPSMGGVNRLQRSERRDAARQSGAACWSGKDGDWGADDARSAESSSSLGWRAWADCSYSIGCPQPIPATMCCSSRATSGTRRVWETDRPFRLRVVIELAEERAGTVGVRGPSPGSERWIERNRCLDARGHQKNQESSAPEGSFLTFLCFFFLSAFARMAFSSAFRGGQNRETKG